MFFSSDGFSAPFLDYQAFEDWAFEDSFLLHELLTCPPYLLIFRGFDSMWMLVHAGRPHMTSQLF